MILTLEEVKVLYALLSTQYISYENEEAIKLIRKIRQVLDEGDGQ